MSAADAALTTGNPAALPPIPRSVRPARMTAQIRRKQEIGAVLAVAAGEKPEDVGKRFGLGASTVQRILREDGEPRAVYEEAVAERDRRAVEIAVKKASMSKAQVLERVLAEVDARLPEQGQPRKEVDEARVGLEAAKLAARFEGWEAPTKTLAAVAVRSSELSNDEIAALLAVPVAENEDGVED